MSRFFILILLLVSFVSSAQTYSVRAKIVDQQSNKYIPYATVVAYKSADSTYVAGGLSDSLGFFELQLRPQKYIIEVSHLGYEKTLITTSIGAEHSILKDIVLVEQTQNMKEAVVSGRTPSVSIRDDRVVYRVSDIPAAKSGTIDEILKSLPSITQDFNGTSLINGVPARFFIDGRELSSSELDAYSPSQIESIEIVANPTSKYDADGLSGIIQLHSKKSKLSGISSAINLSGTHDTQSGSLSVIYNKDKLSLTANTSVSNNYQHGSIKTIANNSYSQNGVKADILNILANVGAEYIFNERNNVNLSYQYIDFGYSSRDFSQSREGVTDMRGVTHQVALTHNYNIDLHGEKLTTNVYYNQTAPKTISLLDYSTQQFVIDNRNSNSSLVAMVDYILPFTSYATFEVGIKSHTRSINVNRVDDFTGTEVADKFSMDESILGVYILMNSRMGKANVQFGIRGESDLLNSNDNIRAWNLFPNLSLDHTNRNNNIFKIGYNSRINRPSVADLNPFLMLIDPTSQLQGDPNLKPEYSHNLYADYIMKGAYNQVKFSAYYRFVKNLITKEYTNIDDKMVKYRPINVAKTHFYGANATLTLKLWNKFMVAPNMGVEFVKLPSKFASEVNSVTTLNAGLNLDLQLQHNINIGSVVRYSSGSFSVGSGSQSAIVQGLAIGLPFFYSELSANKGFFNNKLNVSVRMTDPFDVQRNGFLMYSDGTERESQYLMQMRFVHLGISYRMNNFKSSKRRYDDGGIRVF